MPLIFDCHLDLAWNALTWKRDLTRPLAELNARDPASDEKFRGRATTTLPEMTKGRVAVCLATVMGRVPYGDDSLHGSTLDFATHEQVYAFARGQLAYYEALQDMGHVRLIHTRGELEFHWREWTSFESSDDAGTDYAPPLGIILSMEGADAMAGPDYAEKWFGLGLRSTGLVHYGSSAFAVGTGEEGPLTEAGRKLLSEFQSLGMVLDVTHLSDQSFWEAMECFSGHVIASHQACRALVPAQRQFSDDQLKAVIDRGGVVCVPCDAWMLYPNWVRGETTRDVVSIEALGDQVDHICQLAGNSMHAGIGSDLDGGYGTEQSPTGLDSIADLQKLGEQLSRRGYADADVHAIMGGNAYQFFLKHLPR